MLSAQQHLLVRVAGRNIPRRSALNLIQKQQRNQQSLASFSTLLPSGQGRSKDDKKTTATVGLPLIQPGKNALLKSSVLERAYPWGMGQTPSSWFSTTTKDDDEREPKGYRDRASEYGERARHGAQSFGGMMRKYGPTFVGAYLSVYVGNLSLFYLGIQSGLLDPVTMIGYVTGNHEEVRNTAEVVSELLEHYTVTAPFAETVKDKPQLANFAVAWISTKFTEPIRMGLSVAIVPTVARYLGTAPKIAEEAIEKDDEAEAEGTGSVVTDEANKEPEESKTEEKKP